MSLAGLRFGYALAHPAVAREITKAKLPYNVNRMTLAAAHAALDAPELLEQYTQQVRDARDRLYRGLQGVRGLKAFPTAANFVLIRCDAQPAADVFRRLVEQHGILVRDVSGGAGLEGCLRITAGTLDDVDAVLDALRTIFGSTP
jgi:histidinol-phosphate/aromatic aminotransferase/cobyric acid decarboxylase-like protein